MRSHQFTNPSSHMLLISLFHRSITAAPPSRWAASQPSFITTLPRMARRAIKALLPLKTRGFTPNLGWGSSLRRTHSKVGKLMRVVDILVEKSFGTALKFFTILNVIMKYWASLSKGLAASYRNKQAFFLLLNSKNHQNEHKCTGVPKLLFHPYKTKSKASFSLAWIPPWGKPISCSWSLWRIWNDFNYGSGRGQAKSRALSLN